MNDSNIHDSLMPSGCANRRPLVAVQGLGFVGSAMAVAVADARRPDGEPAFNVVGVDLPNGRGEKAVEALRAGRFPSETVDSTLAAATGRGREAGNLTATTDPRAYGEADVVIVDIHLDLERDGETGEPGANFDGLAAAAGTIGEHMRPGTLVIVEVTVPPGTCRNVVAPALAAALERRGHPPDAFLLAHSYERVMPGQDYLSSIINIWRVFSGFTPSAADACERFLSQVINVADYPLTRLDSLEASETAKLLENSYRATNIAFIEEWARFAESWNIDLYGVIDAIRQRPTHSNIRFPGFGVGGYCLTKDPLFATVGAREFLGRPDLDFPFCRMAVETNEAMPMASVNRLEELLDGLAGRDVLLMGLSYRPGVDDTRYSPSEVFYRTLVERGARVHVHDPLVRHWDELDLPVPDEPPPASAVDAVVFAVGHAEYADMDLRGWLGDARPAVLDANNVLGRSRLEAVASQGCRVASIGRGRLEVEP